MTTNEFIKQVENLRGDLGFSNIKHGKFIDVYFQRVLLFRVFTKSVGRMQIFDLDVSSEKHKQILDVGIEYVQTPIECREEEYYIRFNVIGIVKCNSYLNKIYDAEYFFGDCHEVWGRKTKFTDEEISKLPAWINDMLHDGYLVKEEVKDDNEI